MDPHGSNRNRKLGMSLLSSSLARYTLGLMAGGAAILLMITLSSFWLVSQSQENANNVEQGRAVRISASTILALLLDAETGQRGYLLTGRDAYLAPFETAKKSLPGDIDTLRRAVAATPEIEPDLNRLDELYAQKMDELAKTVELNAAGKHDEALALVNSDRGRQTMDEARALLTKIISSAEKDVAESLDKMDAATRRLAWLTVFGGICIAIFSGTAFYIVTKYTANLVEARREVMALNENLEERVADRTTALQRANDEIQRFAYIVSHDLRAPLVNVMGFTSEMEVGTAALKSYFEAEKPTEEQELAARRAAEEEIPEAVHFIRASTTKMDGLIGAILKLSREGRRELKRERVDLQDLMTTAASSLQHQVDIANAKFEISERLPSVVADRLALEQVFGNILENAVKYLAKDRPGLIKVEGDESGGRVRIKIADNGRGIEEKDLERIFELFRRAGPQDRPGEGVGLAHVRALVRRMGGDVRVSSRFGEGTTFEVDLPKKSKIKDANAETL